ncbi:hypothetical protein LZ32DRAFT_609100 [Colletotrichum eremochloae]|nr:hypothetical protein LZ32DRAFT_609100 [Colletotrichum eremochloae]
MSVPVLQACLFVHPSLSLWALSKGERCSYTSYNDMYNCRRSNGCKCYSHNGGVPEACPQSRARDVWISSLQQLHWAKSPAVGYRIKTEFVIGSARYQLCETEA